MKADVIVVRRALRDLASEVQRALDDSESWRDSSSVDVARLALRADMVVRLLSNDELRLIVRHA